MGIGHEAQIVKLETLLQISRRKLTRRSARMLDDMLIRLDLPLVVVRHSVGLVMFWLIKSVLGARHI